MAKKKPAKASKDEPTFEDALTRLQDVVRTLESGNLTLDDSLAEYEQGIKLLKQCYSALDNVEQKIRELVSVDEQGQAETKSFGHSASHAAHSLANDHEDSDDESDEDDWDDDPDGLF
ncbi:MAG: exodeoxyribonuclease VII small subunit [Pirellulaceae bacterium]